MDNQEQRLDKAVVDAIRARDTREQGYRAQSLKIHPWVCGRCGREFNEKNL
ncbi:MAG TPA: HNH endonuclease, partial [Gammaproteobacteria bacterium]|nr:HNH endonuclease [Gammaproteobacteria bacterium]